MVSVKTVTQTAPEVTDLDFVSPYDILTVFSSK